MGQLREVVEILKKEYLRVKGDRHKRISRKILKSIIKKHDATVLENRAKLALDESYDKNKRATKKEMAMRNPHPGLHDVVFINKHTKEKQVLTRKIGVPYEMAWYYYMYITYFEDEKYNELGHYEIVEHPKPFLAEETHFGIN